MDYKQFLLACVEEYWFDLVLEEKGCLPSGARLLEIFDLSFALENSIKEYQ